MGAWANVLHLTIGGYSTSVYGDRIPCVYFNQKFEISFALNGNAYLHTTILSIAVNQWYSVEIGQSAEGNAYRYYIKVDGKEEYSIINNDARIFQNVKVYASDPWYAPQSGYIKNLYIDSKGKLIFSTLILLH